MSALKLINIRLFDQPDIEEMIIDKGVIAQMTPRKNEGQTSGQNERQTSHNDDMVIIDGKGGLVFPALSDHQVFADKADDNLSDLDQAACAGGIMEALLMPTPNIFSAKTKAHFIQASPITKHKAPLAEKSLAEIGLAYQLGWRFFCDGAVPIENNRLLRQAMSYIADMDALIIHQPQDPNLAHLGVMNEGVISARLGLEGIPHHAETIMLARDLELASLTKARYHAAQISTKTSVEMIERAKDNHLPISCGCSINHLLLTENDIGDFRTFCKLTPPLRTEEDRQALLRGLKNGVIDVIVSGHNPQLQENKRLPFRLAETGAVGMETLLPASFCLHKEDDIPIAICLKALTKRLFDGVSPKLALSQPANLILYHPDSPWRLDVANQKLKALAQNAALDGRQFYGKIILCLFKGEIVFNAISD